MIEEINYIFLDKKDGRYYRTTAKEWLLKSKRYKIIEECMGTPGLGQDKASERCKELNSNIKNEIIQLTLNL